MKTIVLAALSLGGLASCSTALVDRAGDTQRVDAIDTVVVIYAENRAFDTLYGLFPGANGIPGVNPSAVGERRAAEGFRRQRRCRCCRRPGAA